MTVRANVVSLTAISPSPHLSLVVDTNILFWLGYSRATLDEDTRFKLRPYSAFVRRASNAGVTFYCTTLSLVEAMHTIEHREFRRVFPRSPREEIKEFRKDAVNRKAVSAELESFWASAKNLATILPAMLPPDRAEEMLKNKRDAEADAYDLAIVETARALDHKLIVSDDADLLTYDCGVAIVTANPTALNFAREQGKIISPADIEGLVPGDSSQE